MQIRILKTVLTGQSNIHPNKKGDIVDFDSDADALEFIKLGFAEEVGTETKKQPEVLNKKLADPKNKSDK